jgi:hypothetical protein
MPPPAAMTTAGDTSSAAAPAMRNAVPWAAMTPIPAMPKACGRRPTGTRATKALLTAIW